MAALAAFLNPSEGIGKFLAPLFAILLSGGIAALHKACTVTVPTGTVATLVRWGKVRFDKQGLPVVRQAGTFYRVPIRDQYTYASIQDQTISLREFNVDQPVAGDPDRSVLKHVVVDITLVISNESSWHPYQALYGTDDYKGRACGVVGDALRSLLETTESHIKMVSIQEDLFQQITLMTREQLLADYGVLVKRMLVIEHARTPAEVLASASLARRALTSDAL